MCTQSAGSWTTFAPALESARKGQASALVLSVTATTTPRLKERSALEECVMAKGGVLKGPQMMGDSPSLAAQVAFSCSMHDRLCVVAFSQLT